MRSEAAPQRVRAEPDCRTHFCATHSPKSADLLNYFRKKIFLEIGGLLDFAHHANPTAMQLLKQRVYSLYTDDVKVCGSVQYLLSPYSERQHSLAVVRYTAEVSVFHRLDESQARSV